MENQTTFHSNEESIRSMNKNNVSYDIAVMCDRYNNDLYRLFEVYSHPHDGQRYCTVDDYLCFLIDYQILSKFITKDNAISLFHSIITRRDDGKNLTVANYLTYEAFVECICRIALYIFNNPTLVNLYETIDLKISMFIELWNLGDELSLINHREERKQLLNKEI